MCIVARSFNVDSMEMLEMRKTPNGHEDGSSMP